MRTEERKTMKKPLYSYTIKLILLLAVMFGLSGCTPAPPNNINNACAIFQQYPRWYWDALNTYRRWGVPVSVQLAIIKQESHFHASAAPPRDTLWGFIPWKRPTTAYGYAQAVNGTWQDYIQDTGNADASRDSFADASDFIGWYTHQTHQKAGVSENNAYALYLAYHQGINGYIQGNYHNEAWLIQVANKVQHNADIYAAQIGQCKNNITKPNLWNLWLHG